ncbi:MAG TPA: pyridoxamine 5'-phosphate oxidase family protein [Leucothrix mucor]|nr:pyridoxamine 5'-phosphate oxidase family protein [Leucothrix mucor]
MPLGCKVSDSKKVDELWDNPKITITFDNPREDANLIIYGKATIETKPEIKKHCWRKTWEGGIFPRWSRS